VENGCPWATNDELSGVFSGAGPHDRSPDQLANVCDDALAKLIHNQTDVASGDANVDPTSWGQNGLPLRVRVYVLTSVGTYIFGREACLVAGLDCERITRVTSE
jgi:hypothetical protein